MRPNFRFQLATMLAAVLTTGGLMFLNFQKYRLPNDHPYEGTYGWAYGWPRPVIIDVVQILKPPKLQLDAMNLLVDCIVNLFILIGVGLFVEKVLPSPFPPIETHGAAQDVSGGKKKRAWFRFHLSTWVAFIVISALMLWMDLEYVPMLLEGRAGWNFRWGGAGPQLLAVGISILFPFMIAILLEKPIRDRGK